MHVPFKTPERDIYQLREELELVGKTIEKIRYLRLKKELTEGVNPELNVDREVLISRMEQLGFRRAIVDALHELDRKLNEAGKPLDFKGCMDLARTLYEELVEDAAKTSAAKVGRPAPSAGAGNFQPWNQLLMTAGVLTADEEALSQKLYNFLSNVGAHQLGSALEHVRVAKAMIIELGMLVLGRVQALK
jgi:hypothetical protein